MRSFVILFIAFAICAADVSHVETGEKLVKPEKREDGYDYEKPEVKPLLPSHPPSVTIIGEDSEKAIINTNLNIKTLPNTFTTTQHNFNDEFLNFNQYPGLQGGGGGFDFQSFYPYQQYQAYQQYQQPSFYDFTPSPVPFIDVQQTGPSFITHIEQPVVQYPQPIGNIEEQVDHQYDEPIVRYEKTGPSRHYENPVGPAADVPQTIQTVTYDNKPRTVVHDHSSEEIHTNLRLAPIVSKHYFVHSGEDVVERHPTRYIHVGQPQKKLNVLFVKAPTYTGYSKIVPILPQNEDKTVVYVLSKKPEFNQDIEIQSPPPTPAAKPDVFYVKYNKKEEADRIQSQITGAYESGKPVIGSDPILSGLGGSGLGAITNLPGSVTGPLVDTVTGIAAGGISKPAGLSSFSGFPGFGGAKILPQFDTRFAANKPFEFPTINKIPTVTSTVAPFPEVSSTISSFPTISSTISDQSTIGEGFGGFPTVSSTIAPFPEISSTLGSFPGIKTFEGFPTVGSTIGSFPEVSSTIGSFPATSSFANFPTSTRTFGNFPAVSSTVSPFPEISSTISSFPSLSASSFGSFPTAARFGSSFESYPGLSSTAATFTDGTYPLYNRFQTSGGFPVINSAFRSFEGNDKKEYLPPKK